MAGLFMDISECVSCRFICQAHAELYRCLWHDAVAAVGIDMDGISCGRADFHYDPRDYQAQQSVADECKSGRCLCGVLVCGLTDFRGFIADWNVERALVKIDPTKAYSMTHLTSLLCYDFDTSPTGRSFRIVEKTDTIVRNSNVSLENHYGKFCSPIFDVFSKVLIVFDDASDEFVML